MIYRRLAALVVGLGIVVLGLGRVEAGPLAAPDRIPADAMIVISIGDAPAFWKSFRATSLYEATSNLMALPAVQNDPEFQAFKQDLKGAEEQLKVSLDPDSLFTNTLMGADFAMGMRKGTEAPDLLVSFRFNNAKTAETFLKQIESEVNQEEGSQKKAEASEAPGMEKKEENAKSAPKSTYQTIAGQKVLVVPNEGLWAAQKGDTLVLTSSADMMNRSLTTTAATNVLKSNVIQEGMKALGNPTGFQGFFFIDYAAILKSVAETKPEMKASLASMGEFSELRVLGVMDIGTDYVRVRAFTPTSGASPIVKEIAMKYPAGKIRATQVIPGSSMIGFSFNNFDGPQYYDMTIDSLAEMAGAMQGNMASTGSNAQDQMRMQINQQVAQFESMLGFKVKDELLASLGPEGAVVLENFMFNPLMGPYPNLDLTFSFEIKDKSKLDGVLMKLEEFLTKALPAMMGAGSDPGAPPPSLKMTELSLENAKGKVLVLPQLPGFALGWVILDGKYVVIGTTENALKHACQSYAGAIPSMTATPDYGKIKSYLPTTANAEMMLSVRTIADFVSNLIMMMAPQSVSGDNGTVFLAAMDIVKSVSTMYGSTVIDPKGDKISTVVLSLNEAQGKGAEGSGAKPQAPETKPEEKTTK